MGASLAPSTDGSRHDSGIASLLLLNGPPGIGKSTLARRWAEAHPPAFVVEVDELRTTLPGWQEELSSRLVARDLAVALARDHLAAGDAVVVPQYLGRPDFVVALEELAADQDASFTHVVLTATVEALVGRFRQRRAELLVGGARHPEGDLADDEIEGAITEAVERLGAMAWRRGVVVVDAGGSIEDAERALIGVLRSP